MKDRKKRTIHYVPLIKSYWFSETHGSLCVRGGAPNDAGCLSSACRLTGTCRSWVHNAEQTLFNLLTFMRFMQENTKSLAVTSQTDLRSITNKWSRGKLTKKKGRDHRGVISTYRNIEMIQWLFLEWWMKGKYINYQDTKLISETYWLHSLNLLCIRHLHHM